MIDAAIEGERNVGFDPVHLLDGRRVILNTCGVNSITDDIGDHILNFSWAHIDVPWHRSIVKVIVGMLATHSTIYVSRCLRLFGNCIRDQQIRGNHSESFDLSLLDEWPKRYGCTTWPFMRAVLSRWAQSKLTGLHSDVVKFLENPEPYEEKGQSWYFALVANDPERGAFTEQELRSIREGLDEAFSGGRISLPEWALVWFLIATGVRPVQIARMKISDVIVTSGPEGHEITLAIPLAKGENQIVRDRWMRKSPTVLTEVLQRYLASLPGRDSDPDQPLFQDQSSKIARKVRSVFNRVETYSERLRGPVPIFPYRFRYTLGTRAIALGASDYEAARLLTHRTTTCVHYYRAAMPAFQRPIRDAIGEEMSFLAHAFQGRLIGSLDEATRKGQAGALIRDFAHLMGQKLGACGTNADCHQHAPRACLSCRKFEPLADAPWERFLSVLRGDLAAETEDRIRLITQEQIDAVLGIIAQRNAHYAEPAQ